MKDEDKTKEQLIAELTELRGSLAEMEKRERRRKEAEKELFNALTLNQTILDTSPAAIIIYKASGPGVLANDAAAKIVGGSREQLAAMNFHSIASWKTCGLYEAACSAVETGKVVKIETDIVTTFGRDIRIDATFSTFTLGEDPYLALLFNDITERRLAEGVMRLQSEIARNIAEGIYLVSAKDLKIVYANPKMEEMFGYAPGEMNGQHVSIINARAESDPVETAMQINKELTETGAWRGDVFNVRKDGTTFWGHASISRLHHPEYGEVYVSLQTDITERKQIDDFQVFLAQCGNAAPGEDFFHSLAHYLAQKLGTDFVCIDRLEEGHLVATTVAVYFDGKFEDNMVYALRDTPCGAVLKKAVCCFPSGVSQLFPDDKVLQDMKAESYAGTLLWDHQGRPIGLIALIWRKPLADPALVKSVLQLVSVRAAGELERKLAEDALRKSEERYRQIFEQIMDYILVLEPVENGPPLIIDASNSAFEKHGYSRDEMIGMPITFLDPEEDKIPVRLDNLFRHGFAQFDVIHKRKDGSSFPAEVFGKVITIEGKTLLYTIERDMTERKQAEAELRMLSTAIEQSPASVVITDADGNIEYVNPKFTKLTGYTLEEAVGQNPRILKSGVQGPEVYEQLWKTIASGDVWRGEFCNKKKNGELYWESAVISPVKDANGLITHFLAVKEDITELKKVEEEKKRLEAQLRQAQKLETIGTLAGGIAHDFNNILQPVSSCTDMLRSHLPADSPLRKYVDLMSRAVERGSGLVRQLLTFSRQREHERRPLRLKPVIEETLNLLRAVMPSTVDVQTQITPAGGLVLADPVQVQQVVMNLCTNACDAMDRNGELTVRLEEVDVDKVAAKGGLRLRPGRYARIAVHDTGHGMDDETQKRIFDPFFTTKEVGRGTGLGLSVVHGIVLEHDGEVVVESEPAKGTTFMVYLPLIDAAVEEKSEHHAEEAHKGKGNVLFVDDNEDIVILAEEMMEHLGYTVTATTRQAEALDIFRRDPRGFDLIISDYSMPGITGIQFAWEILNIRPDIPILLITGNNEAIPPAKLKEIPIRGVLSKPFKMDKISETIRRVLEGQAD